MESRHLMGVTRMLALLTLVAITAAGRATLAAPSTQQDVSVTMQDFRFEPARISVPAGTTVTWRNSGGAPHTATSDTGLWNSGTLTTNESFSFTFSEAGTFPYFCSLHGSAGGNGMAGTIVVTAAQADVTPTPAPADPTPTPAPADPTPTPAAPTATPQPAAPTATSAPAPVAEDMTFSAMLTGAAEVPGPGDPDGSGTATITLRPESGEVCWDMRVANITLPATAAHIHEGAADVAGPIVVPLTAPDAGGMAAGCDTAEAALISRIGANPAAFYVNVHTSDYPPGAVRGQLATGAAAPALISAPAPAPSDLPVTGASGAGESLLVIVALGLMAVGAGVLWSTRRRPRHH